MSERFGEDMLCVSKLCDDKLCVDKLCVDKLCEDKLCVDKLWAGGAGGGGGGGGGIQNQKQEPHTKMWGKNVEPNFAQAAAHLPVKK